MTLQTKIANALKERCEGLGLDIPEEIFEDYDIRVAELIKKQGLKDANPEQLKKGDFPDYTNNFASKVGIALKNVQEGKDPNKFYTDIVYAMEYIGLPIEEALQLEREDSEFNAPLTEKITELSIRYPTDENRSALNEAIAEYFDCMKNKFGQAIMPIYFILRKKGYTDNQLVS